MDKEIRVTVMLLLGLGLLGLGAGSGSLLALDQGSRNCVALCGRDVLFADRVGPRVSQLLVGLLWVLVGSTLTSAAISVWRNR